MSLNTITTLFLACNLLIYQITSTTGNPTVDPTDYPTPQPTSKPTHSPSINPTVDPTTYPTPQPSQPTHSPTVSSINPTIDPTAYPTPQPTSKPTRSPSKSPTTNISQCFIGDECDDTDSCCPDNINARSYGITCSIKHKQSLESNTLDHKCCIKSGYKCMNDRQCCGKKNICHRNHCINQQRITFDSISNYEKVDNNLFSAFNYWKHDSKWKIMIVGLSGVLLATIAVCIMLCVFVCVSQRIDLYHSNDQISNVTR
eukprot:311253_1